MRYFRQNYFFCILVVLLPLPVSAANVTLAWSPARDPMITGYNLYFGGVSGRYTNRISIGAVTNVTVSGLIPGVAYYFAARARTSDDVESPLSNEVSCKVPQAIATANRIPTLDAIGNLNVSENAGLQTVTLTGITSGAIRESQTLTVKAVSSNTGLIRNPIVNYTSPNTTGSLSFQPAVNRTGTAIITVTVNDGGVRNNSVTRKFAVTVPRSPSTTTGSRPVLTCPLTNQVAVPGQTRSFAVKATGKSTLKYQWKFDGAVLASAVSPTLTLENITTNQSGVYTVTVTDRNGTTNSAASLTVYATAAGTLASAGLANGHYTLAVPMVPGCRYIVQASTDFVDWEPVTTNTAPFTFVDAQAGRFNQRFYRTVYVP